MKEKPFLTLDALGRVTETNEEAARLLGIPRDEIMGQPLDARMIAEHKIRFEAELSALVDGSERHGRLHCTLLGLDGIGRRITMVMNQTGHKLIHAVLSSYQHPESFRKAPGSSLIDSGRLLPVARRISAISRHASTVDELLKGGLEVFAEVTSASTGAALEWEVKHEDQSIITFGPFDKTDLHGTFRPAVLTRLTRGDVVVKETDIHGTNSDACLIIVPLLSRTAPLGIIVLSIPGYSVLVPEEQQSLAILGEIMGLGLKALTTATKQERGLPARRGDAEAGVALGRLSSGLAHEINNAATVLRNNLEQFMLHDDGYGYGTLSDSAIKDSLTALNAICDLNDALRAFAPEETPQLEEVDILRILDMVVRSVRFYAKRGMNLTLNRPDNAIPAVHIRSHFLIRSLFIIFVELVETSLDSGTELNVHLELNTDENHFVTLTIAVTAGPVSLPANLLSQLEKGGALARHVVRAGAKLSHTVDHEGNLSMSVVLPEVKRSTKSIPHAPISPPTRRGTILIADDVGAVVRSLRRILERDHDVLAARTGEEALSIVKSNSTIDIILYDASMPRLSGPEFFEEVRLFNLATADRVIFVTGGAADTEIARFLQDTPNTVIDKPFDLPQLNDIIASLLK